MGFFISHYGISYCGKVHQFKALLQKTALTAPTPITVMDFIKKSMH